MGSLGLWEADLRYEMNAMGALPHTVVYVEGGYSDANSHAYANRYAGADSHAGADSYANANTRCVQLVSRS